MGIGKGSLNGGSIYRGFTKYPRCRIFSCPKLRGVSYKCCYFCDKRDKCSERCLNTPEKCGMCIIPDKEEAEKMIDLPDHPDIRKMELYGTLHPEEIEVDPICPICQEECETIYLDMDGDAFGCDLCIKKVDACEWKEKHKE